MKNRTILIAVVAVLAAGIVDSVAVAQSPLTPKKQQAKKQEGASRSGCVDEQEGHYVLVDDRELKVVANLEADGFPTEGFAKHVGQKVTVRGIVSPDGLRPVFKVRSIETVSQTCAPDSTPAGKY